MDSIFNGVENEMPDCKDMAPQSRPDSADRKTPGKEQAGGGLSIFVGVVHYQQGVASVYVVLN